ncbi:unnamed protein product [Arctia plantaginis]|uniref:Uncharacterized protein n=1 Tax=Arctia plantaginis TaxID=874455 RepID=A0A8S0YR11_ARCPL|nr:unnamed protein product [Arctia plantaginis]
MWYDTRGKPASGNRNTGENRNQRNEVREFEERPRQSRGATQRSQQWEETAKENEQAAKKHDAAVSYDFKAKDETAPVDQPLYDLGPQTSSIPVQEVYSQNCEFAGYMIQVERTYE